MAFSCLTRRIYHELFKSSISLRFARYKSDGIKVSLINSGNHTGVALAYLLKKSSVFSEICLFDFQEMTDVRGITTDLNNINTSAQVTYYEGDHSLMYTLQDSNIVVALNPDSNKDDQIPCSEKFSTDFVFRKNAELLAQLAEAYALQCPSALFVVVTGPVNSTVPLACKVAVSSSHAVSLNRILGFTTHDVVQANLLWSDLSCVDLPNANVPVIGGSSINTLIPLFSRGGRCKENFEPITDEDIKELTEKLRKQNDHSTRTMDRPYSVASSINRFVLALAMAVLGNKVKEYAFTRSDILKGTNYLAGPVQLGPAGIQKILPLGELSKYEKLLLDSVAFYLEKEVKRGEDYAEHFLMRSD